MKRWLSVLLSFALALNFMMIRSEKSIAEEALPDYLMDYGTANFESLDDPALLQYLEDSVYAQLEAEFADSESTFVIEDVSAIYISKEYLEETEYNTRANIFFGYTLADINEVFRGEKYVFTLSDTGETVVQEYLEIPNDSYNRIIRNVLIGTGVILVCVTVAVLTAGAAAPAAAAGGSSVTSLVMTSAVSTATKVHLIFAASAHTAATMAASGTVISGVTTFVSRGFETGWDLETMTESATVQASEGFKWGAITGAVAGGAKETFRIHKISHGALSPREAEQMAHKYFGGREQVTYLNGEEVPYGTPGGVRPDVVVGKEAIEVKCYDITQASNLYELRQTLTTEISQRVLNLPSDMTQRIVLNVEGRGLTAEYVENVVNWIHDFMEPIYHDIPIDVMGAML